MSAERAPLPPSKLLSRLVASAIVGWALVYNVMRIAGSNPSQAAWPSAAIGGLAGAAVFVAVVAVLRRRGGRGAEPAAIPGPDALDSSQRDALRAAAVAVGLLAAVALVTALAIGIQYLDAPPGDRPLTNIILGGWDLVVGIWLADEAVRALRLEGEGVDAIPLIAAGTCVLAGLGLSRGLVEPLQVAVIIVAAIGGALAAIAAWRLAGARGLPWWAGVVVVVAALSLVIPLL